MRGPVLHIERCYGIFKKGTIVSQISLRRVSAYSGICCNLHLCPLHQVCFLCAIHRMPRSAFAGTLGKNCAMTQTRLAQTLLAEIFARNIEIARSLCLLFLWKAEDFLTEMSPQVCLELGRHFLAFSEDKKMLYWLQQKVQQAAIACTNFFERKSVVRNMIVFAKTFS